MNILGVNEGHMCSASLIQDGKVIAAVCEERFTRNKNEQGFPKNAIEYCLKEGKLERKDVDFIASTTLDLEVFVEATKRYVNFSLEGYLKENREYWKPVLIEKKDIDYFSIFPKVPNENYDFSFLEKEPDRKKWTELFRKERKRNFVKEFGISENKINFIDHHTGHAYYAYFMSPLRNNVLVVTADAWGDGCNCSISIGNDNKIELKLKSPNNFLARWYKYITLLLGMKPNEDEYKVMGLAPYATDYQIQKSYKIFKNTLYVDGLDFKFKEKPSDSYYWFKERLEGHRFDGIAGALQKYVEEIMSEWIRNAISKFNVHNVVFSGGLALNIKINKKLSELDGVNNIFVPGGGGDESLSIGAALFQYNKTVHEPIFQPPNHDYLGPRVDPNEVGMVIKKMNLEEKFKVTKNITNKTIAEFLSKNFIVARCCGRSEFGPRALGNRSILANPSNRENLLKINNQIKYRDFWMPFTPSILYDRVNDYIKNPKNIHSPFMTIAFDSTELARKELIAALHPADFTVRPQFVEEKYNPEYYDLIKEFEKITGIGGLLNTSLNLHGEPIIGNVQDAIHTMNDSELDVMIIEDVLIERRAN